MKKYVLSYLKYLKPHWKLFAIAFTCGVLYGASSGLGLPIIAEKVFKIFLEESEREFAWWEIAGATLLLPAIFLLRGILGFINGILMCKCSLLILLGLRDDIFKKLQELPLSYYDNSTSGDLITRVFGDAGIIHSTMMSLASDTLKQPFVMLSGMGALIYLSYDNQEILFLLAFLLAGALFVIPVVMLRKKLKVGGRRLIESSANIAQVMMENIGAVNEIRTFNMEEKQRELFLEQTRDYNNKQLKLVKYQSLQRPTTELLSVCIIAGLFYYGYTQKIDYATFAGLGLALFFTFDPLKRILAAASTFHSAFGSFQRVEETLEMKNPIVDPEDPLELTDVKGDVEMRNLSFAYVPGIPVLHDVNVTIPAGQYCALVGPSGSGKSTFAKLIPRLYEADQGEVLVDGTNIKEVRMHDLRSHIAFVSQSPVLFNTSLMDNIRLGKPGATNEEVIQAAIKAYAHDFIMDFELGYSTLAGERGGNLSGGQKQRIAIARAILRDAPVLILDEATSALDAESEAYVQAAVKELVKNRTVITIAHRLSTFQHAERILVFNEGRIIASGPHGELMESCGVYKTLVNAQKARQ